MRTLASIARHEPKGHRTRELSAIDARRVAPETKIDRLLRCVSSGYLSGGCSCQATVPSSVVHAAWACELERARGPEAAEDRFFNFRWRGGEWLAFGLLDGRVRGVYCPEHSAERAGRSCAPSLGVAS